MANQAFSRIKTSTTSLFCTFLLLAACATQDSADTSTKTPAKLSIENTEWKSYTVPAAIEYHKLCKADYEKAIKQLRLLESNSFKDEELLSEINKFDLILDGLGNKASLYNNVHPEPEVRDAAGECEQKTMAVISEASLSVPIYKKISAVDTGGLSAIDQRYVQKMLESFELSGVNKEEKVRTRIAELNDEILVIGQDFSKNIREDVRSVSATIAELEGLPQDFIDAHPVDEAGNVTITTKYPDYLPVMQYAKNDDLRFRLYKEFRKRGYPQNKPILESLLARRYEYAQLLGFDSYAQYITSNKMIGSAQNAKDFINKINNISMARSNLDYAQLLSRLKQIDPSAAEVGDWQKTYVENLVKNEVYKVDSQAVRQYFSFNNVQQGIFDLVEHLFEVEIKPWQTEVWDPSVNAYQIVDKNGVVGEFYLDMHPRDGKYSHAAAFRVRTGITGLQTPISALICNFPSGDGLMEHDQVETFLHEFGHLLHGLFGGHQKWQALSGIATEWDFVEAPSQMLEEWVWDADTLKTFAKNSEGEVIPNELVVKMNKAREFGKGIWTRQQMFYAAMSLNFYNRPSSEVDLDKMMVKLQGEYSPFAYVDDTYMYASFGHLDGYSAIYYTYMWSLVIAADMFSEFEKHGLRDHEVAQRYRKTVLAPGGTKDAADLVKDFLGRPYSFDAFAKTLSGGQ